MTRSSIPLQTEVIVQIAHRFRDAAPAVTATIHRYPLRTPAELEQAVDAIHADLWSGIMALLHAQQRAGAP